jgi:hypothetical protein
MTFWALFNHWLKLNQRSFCTAVEQWFRTVWLASQDYKYSSFEFLKSCNLKSLGFRTVSWISHTVSKFLKRPCLKWSSLDSTACIHILGHSTFKLICFSLITMQGCVVKAKHFLMSSFIPQLLLTLWMYFTQLFLLAISISWLEH